MFDSIILLKTIAILFYVASAIIYYLVLFCTYEYKENNDGQYQYIRVRRPLWMYIAALGTIAVPILNIFSSLAMLFITIDNSKRYIRSWLTKEF